MQLLRAFSRQKAKSPIRHELYPNGDDDDHDASFVGFLSAVGK